MVVLSKMAEVLFIEALRRHMDEMPQDQSGWLAGARDKVVGSALLLLHRKASHPWTIEELARQVGTSRTVLTDRFARFLGEPPLGLPGAMADAARREASANDAEGGIAGRIRCRLRIRSRFQSRFQKGIRPAAWALSQLWRGRVTIALAAPSAEFGRTKACGEDAIRAPRAVDRRPARGGIDQGEAGPPTQPAA